MAHMQGRQGQAPGKSPSYNFYFYFYLVTSPYVNKSYFHKYLYLVTAVLIPNIEMLQDEVNRILFLRVNS